VTGGAIASFAYNALRRRTARTTGGVTTSYLYDGLDVVQEQIAGTRRRTTCWAWASTSGSPRSDATGTSTFLSDALGSTVALADAAGVVQTSYTGSPHRRSPTIAHPPFEARCDM
jgi:hypothetical protein